MTGFGSAVAAGRDFRTIIHIKALNSRFLDLKLLVPPVYASLEADFRAELQKTCARGRLTALTERFPQEPFAPVSLNWSRPQALRWKKLYQAVAEDLKIKNALDVSHLTALKGVTQSLAFPVSVSAREKALVKAAFKKALLQCNRERIREGKSLKKDIVRCLRSLSVRWNRLKKLNGLQKQKARRFAAASAAAATRNGGPRNGGSGAAGLDKGDKAKFDFNEELIRLKEHIVYCRQILRKESAEAKKLEFYAQELLREFNTIGSKASLAASTAEVVEGKFIVERIKELSQNLE